MVSFLSTTEFAAPAATIAIIVALATTATTTTATTTTATTSTRAVFYSLSMAKITCFSEELVDIFFQNIDPLEPAGRDALKNCRLVSRQYRRIANSYAFRIFQITGTANKKENAFQSHTSFAANPANSNIISLVEELIVAGDSQQPSTSHRDYAVLDRTTLWNIIKNLYNMKSITLYRVQWSSVGEQCYLGTIEDPFLELLNKLPPKLFCFAIQEFFFCERRPQDPCSIVQLPTSFEAPTITELQVRDVDLDTWGQASVVYPWTFSRISIISPNRNTMGLFTSIYKVTHLEIWNIDDTNTITFITTMLRRSRKSLKILGLDIRMKDGGTSQLVTIILLQI